MTQITVLKLATLSFVLASFGYHGWTFTGADADEEEDDAGADGDQEEEGEGDEEEAKNKKKQFGYSKHFDAVALKVS